MSNSNKKYVLLQGLKKGNKFFTSNTRNDPTKLNTGEIVYKVLGYAETVEEAQDYLYESFEEKQNLIMKHLLDMPGTTINKDNVYKYLPIFC